MLEQLARNPLIQKYIPDPFSRHTASTEENSPFKTLEAIYIDTAALMQATEVLSKEEASSNLVELMDLFPDTTKFFINAWTWGYEDLLKTIARNFSSKVDDVLSIVRATKESYRYTSTATSTISTIGSAIRFSPPSRLKRLECAFTRANDGIGALKLKTAKKTWYISTQLIWAE
jgi:hypothetical protein